MHEPQVIDFFCGAGGFSEGFRQMGFKITMGIDNWEPAVKTFNHNFNLNCTKKNVLDFENSIEEIENLPNTEVIIGSPPCVSFSNSNKSGKADKSLGIRLTESFLRVIAVKKHCINSSLQAWYMENVLNSVQYLKDHYSFRDLNLVEWATKNDIDPDKIAIQIKDNYGILNSADFGAPQIRKRIIYGEIVKEKRFIYPEHTHASKNENNNLPSYITLGSIKNKLPNPNARISKNKISDPNYNNLILSFDQITDHFYDTGLHKCVWKQSQYFKTNHPFMGKMSFPENENNPSRTITATNIGTSREAIIYKSEYKRFGNGEYRVPTVRESACLMGFPLNYQFIGAEGAKSRLVGNAVCPPVSRSLAISLRRHLKLGEIAIPKIYKSSLEVSNNNLNSNDLRDFSKTPIRKKGSRFRRHPFKDGNITVTLSNYDIVKNSKNVQKWITSVQYGNGNGYPTHVFPDGYYEEIESIIETCSDGRSFLEIMKNGFESKIAHRNQLQKMYELQESFGAKLEPVLLVEEVKRIIEELSIEDKRFKSNGFSVFPNKETVPLKQLFALYSINKISTIANK